MNNLLVSKVAVVVLVVVAVNVRADLPDDRSVYFIVRENPTNHFSQIEFTMSINIRAVDMVDNSVAWEIVSIEFAKPGTIGSPQKQWINDFPFVNTVDGLWWVDHIDPINPVRDEFTLPPTVLGLATAEDPGNPDLNYDVSGNYYTPPPGGAPYETTTALSYSLSEEGSNDPPQTGDEKPAEMPDGTHDPY